MAFSAGLTDSGSVGPFDVETTLIFSKTFSNVGGAYDQSTGDSPCFIRHNLVVEEFLLDNGSSPACQACSQLLSEDFTSSVSQPLITSKDTRASTCTATISPSSSTWA